MSKRDLIDAIMDIDPSQDRRALAQMSSSELKQLLEERDDDSDLFPNGRDYDFADEDGI